MIQDSRTAAEGPTVGEDVVVTHDGDKLFAYASGRRALDDARAALEAALGRKDLAAEIVDRPLGGKARALAPGRAAARQRCQGPSVRRAGGGHAGHRTLVASAGRFVQEEFEQTMVAAANRLELAYKFVEHRHLLTTQVAFTVTGPRHAVAEFERELRATARTTVRCQEEIGFSL